MMSSEGARRYIGIDSVGNVMEEVDGVVYIAGCREDLNFYEAGDVEGGLLENEFEGDMPPDGEPSYVFTDVAPDKEKAVGGEMLGDDESDDEEFVVGKDQIDDNADESAVPEAVLGEDRINELLATEKEVILLDGGLGQESSNLLFRISNDNTILVDDPSGSAATKNDEVPTPEVGMLFDLAEEFIAYAHRHGHSKGHGMRIYGSDRDPRCPERVKSRVMRVVNGVLISGYTDCFRIRMCCRKEGHHVSKSPDPDHNGESCRTGCMYKITARRNPMRGDPWRISSITPKNEVKKHNHEFQAEYSNFLPRYRVISPGDQMKILELQKAGVKATTIYDYFVNEKGGFRNVPFTELDLRNFLNLRKPRPLKDGDFAAMEEHFRKMRQESPGFVYDFEKDKDGRLKSVFWADSRCIQAFLEFGDVVSFDTTFLCNRYRMPFAVFVGTNHYGKTILFGCALLASEDTESFVWLFETWKKCMGGKSPLRILTDQAVPIGNAIELVFPDAAHRWCMWHVMQNCRKHLGKRKEWSDIYRRLQDVLHDSFSINEFEERWNTWVSDFNIGLVEWVKRMFSDRSKWCPVYFKSEFWAGMSSTQRSEGMHHYFKGYVNINTCLSEFVEKYTKAICRRIAEEEKDIVKGKDRHSVVSSRHAFEPIFEKLYSRPKYIEIHDELIDMAGNIATKVGETDTEVLYDVMSKTFRVGWTTKRIHRVVFVKQTSDVHCECKNFEFRGILCSHALRVFWVEDTAEVPGKFILDRWRKDLPRKYVTHIYPEAAVMGQDSLPAQRFKEMQRFCEGISCMVMNDEELHNDVLGLMKNIKEKLTDKIGLPDGIGTFERGTVGKVYSAVDPSGSTIRSSIRLTVVENDVKDPVDKRGRGKAPVKRKMSTAEIIGRRSKAKHNQVPSPAQFSPSTPSPSTPVKMVWAPATTKIAGKQNKQTFKMNSGTGCFR